MGEPVHPECGHKTPLPFCAACYVHDWQRKVWVYRFPREQPGTADAVDPQAGNTGKPTPRA